MPARHTRTAREAADAAAELGFPVVLKVLSADILHKSDIGGVRLGVADRAAAEAAFDEILAAARAAEPQAAIDGCLVAPMVTGGVETILGVQRDPVFGPIVMFGLGGIFVEALKDVTFRAAPFDETEARAMIEEIAAYPVLTGLRGEPPADLDALAAALSRLSLFAAATPPPSRASTSTPSSSAPKARAPSPSTPSSSPAPHPIARVGQGVFARATGLDTMRARRIARLAPQSHKGRRAWPAMSRTVIETKAIHRDRRPRTPAGYALDAAPDAPDIRDRIYQPTSRPFPTGPFLTGRR